MSKGNPEIVGRLIASTKRKTRALSIVEIAKDILQLKEELGSMQAVADVLKLSTGMLNQFISVFQLPPYGQKLVEERKIDGVAAVFMLTKFQADDLRELIPLASSGKINSQELKVLLPFRKKHPNENIHSLIEKVYNSKNIKASVLRLPKDIIKDIAAFEKAIKTLITEENYLSTEEKDGFVDVKIRKEGESILRDKAKQHKLSLQQFITRLISYGR